MIIFNKNYLKIEQQQQPIDIESLSFESLISFAKEILYELESISCCFNYKRGIDATKDEYFNSYLIQINILIRTILSQSIHNVQLLFDNGLDSNNFKSFPFENYRNPLYYAFHYKNLEIFHYFIQNNFSIEEGDIFYDFNHKKDLKFSVYLYFFFKQKNFSVLNKLKFDYS